MTSRAAVVQEARSWLGTKYQHQARLKGVAVDCLGIVIGVARHFALVAPDFDITGYSRQPNPKLLMAKCREHLIEIDVAAVQIADIVVTCVDDDPTHFAILADWRHGGLSMIHALNRRGGRGSVVEHGLDATNRARVFAAFALPGVA